MTLREVWQSIVGYISSVFDWCLNALQKVLDGNIGDLTIGQALFLTSPLWFFPVFLLFLVFLTGILDRLIIVRK